jgi:patatin-like phospholipase/acyl hydrolase
MSPPFRILSLDGGGIRGVFPAAFLAKLEEHLDAPIGSYFDLIAGTSTGGIIASIIVASRISSDSGCGGRCTGSTRNIPRSHFWTL